MQKALVDTGPLVALFDRNDRYYQPVLSFIKNYSGQLITSWPVLTEVSHLLDFSIEAQLDFLKWAQRGGVKIELLEEADLDEIITLTSKYRDCPMDLADASLLVLAKRLKITHILTLDRDFLVYRLPLKKSFKNLLTL